MHVPSSVLLLCCKIKLKSGIGVMDYSQFARLNSAGGAAIGVGLGHYAFGKLGFFAWLIEKLPGGNIVPIAVDAAAGVAVMNVVGEAPINVNTIVMAGGVAIAMNMLLTVLPQNLQDTLSGK